MQLTPRYEGPEPVRVHMPLDDVSVPLLRQRRRLAANLGALDVSQWSVASRCDGWSVQDVVAHLVGTDRFWAASIRSGLAGTPTKFLSGFDPVATPAAMVSSTRDQTPAAVLDDFGRSLEGLVEAIAAIDADSWTRLAEAPPGHIALRAVAMHALWDSWVHERDIVVPLGLPTTEEPDELIAALAYVAALGPTVRAVTGSDRPGVLAVRASSPTIEFAVEAGPTVVVRSLGPADVGAPCLDGRAADLIEGLSFRTPLHHSLAADDQWLVGGLDEVFDRAAAAS